jgi:HlyD family secretion protein
MRRDQAQLEGQLGQIEADMAAAKASIAQLELMRDRVVHDFLADTLNELATADRTVAELWPKRLAGLDLLRRTEIRSPVDGIVNQSVVQTVGGIVGPGQVLMRIVPQQADPAIDVRVSPLDVDKIHVGQGAIVRMSSLETRVTPDLSGEIRAISADLLSDPASGAQFYQARLYVPPSEFSKLPAEVRLVPGMPVETFIQTGDRTVWSYLTHPIAELLARSMRE